MNIVQERRVGNLKVSMDFIKTEPNVVQKILSEMLIVETENSFINGVVSYKGYSQHFDVVNPGEMIPDYMVHIETEVNESRQTTIKSIRFECQYRTHEFDTLFEDWINVRLVQKEND